MFCVLHMHLKLIRKVNHLAIVRRGEGGGGPCFLVSRAKLSPRRFFFSGLEREHFIARS